MVVPADVAAFGEVVAARLASVLGDDLIGAWFIGSIALDGYVPGESDVDIAAMCRDALADDVRRAVADAVEPILDSCPARGLEMSVHLLGGEWQVNVNGGPRMEHTRHFDASAEPPFWWTLDRAIAARCGVPIIGPPAADVFPPIVRDVLLDAMAASMRWHREHEGPTLYSVLNACRAWRYAETDELGSKLAGGAWARARWHRPEVIDAGIALRHGRPASLDAASVDELLAHVVGVLEAS